MNETEIEEGDNMITVFYRTYPHVTDTVPLLLNYTHFSQSKDWNALLADAEK